MIDHVNYDCMEQELSCPYQECKVVYLRKHSLDHKKVCEFEIIDCKKCEFAQFKRQKLHEHDCIGNLKKMNL